jgi:PRC-barrel domain
MPQNSDAQEREMPATQESTEDVMGRRGSPVFSSDGHRIGQIEEVYEDSTNGNPEWIGLGVGLLYLRRTLVPLRDAVVDADGVHTVRHTKDVTVGAPEADLVDGAFLSTESERALAAYYGLPAPPDEGRPRLRLRRYADDKLAEPPEEDASSPER